MRKFAGRGDPRLSVLDKRLSAAKRILVVMSSKGGVGKTVFSTVASLALAERGFRTGLLDLDLTNSTTHVVLGIDPLDYRPAEERGLVPPKVHGIEYFAIGMLSGDRPLPLRGRAIDNAFLEIMAIVKWGRLDYLLIDTPPSVRDEHLDVLTFIGDRSEAILITTPSPMAIKSVSKLLELLRSSNYRVRGLVENMSEDESLRRFCVENDIAYLGSIPHERGLDSKLGSVNSLRQTTFWSRVNAILDMIVS